MSEEGKQGETHAGLLIEQPSSSLDKDWLELQGGQQIDGQSRPQERMSSKQNSGSK